MTITLDGTLGITTPAETVQGALTTTGNTILGDATTDTLNVGNGGLVKDASGNVGIGTATPTRLLDVSNTAGDATVAITSSTTGQSSIWFADTDINIGGIYYEHTNNAMGFRTNDVERMRIDSSGNLLFNSGYGSVATAYGCRAWVNFNGTGTVAIRGSGNVSSITDNGTGNYRVNFTNAMPDANYSYALAASDSIGGFGIVTTFSGVPPSTTSIGVKTVDNSNAFQDSAYTAVSIFR